MQRKLDAGQASRVSDLMWTGTRFNLTCIATMQFLKDLESKLDLTRPNLIHPFVASYELVQPTPISASQLTASIVDVIQFDTQVP